MDNDFGQKSAFELTRLRIEKRDLESKLRVSYIFLSSGLMVLAGVIVGLTTSPGFAPAVKSSPLFLQLFLAAAFIFVMYFSYSQITDFIALRLNLRKIKAKITYLENPKDV